jgi:menaquinone-dependent protoporphyrinogen oxidase
MVLLVAYASTHGSTKDIADRIATRLRTSGLEAVSQAVDTVQAPEKYDGFVIGSAIYAGSWIADAVAFVERHRDALVRHPVWLFSVGSLDNQGGLLKNVEWPEAKQVEGLSKSIKAHDHRMFAGAIKPDDLSFLVRLIFRATGGRYGDFRKWEEIDEWTDDIAGQLATDNSKSDP